MTVPLVSVLIPTHNRADHVAGAIASIFAQTLADFELVVVDDGSTDATPALLAGITDPRLRVVRHSVNRGIPAARNSALDAARGRYVAWLDSDDVARPTRLARQIAYLERHPDTAVVGACVGKLTAGGAHRPGVRVPPLTAPLIAAWMLFRSAFQQSSVTGRASVLRAYRYDPALDVCEDLDMFLRLSRSHRLANLPQVLVDRRLHAGQTVRQRQGAIRAAKQRLYAPLLAELGVEASADDLSRHVLLGKARLDGVAVPDDFQPWVRDWLARLASANMRTQRFDPANLALASGYVRLLAARAATGGSARALTTAAMPRAFLSRPALAWGARALPTWLARGA